MLFFEADRFISVCRERWTLSGSSTLNSHVFPHKIRGGVLTGENTFAPPIEFTGFLAVVRIAKKQKGHSGRLKDANPGPHSLFSTYYPSNHYPTTYLVFFNHGEGIYIYDVNSNCVLILPHRQ